ncbi:MAG: hypothetical protein GY953_10945, partial [bacterium]|nr:hypothetical protein [bacterium]
RGSLTATFSVSGGGGGGGGTTGDNLIQNPGVESTQGTPNCGASAASIPGWITDGNVGVCIYGTGTYPGPNDPGPPDRGSNFFFGGNASTSQLRQQIDVSSLTGQVDAGNLPFTLSGYLGGWQSQNDQVAVRAEFAGGSSAVLGTASIGPVTAQDRGNRTGLLPRTTTGSVPTGTRAINVIVTFTRSSGSANDGYADNLSLVLGQGGGGGGGCNFLVTPLAQSFGADGGTQAVRVEVQPGCSWTARSNNSWITLTQGASGSGTGLVEFRVSPNPNTTQRTGTLTIAGFTHTVTQSGGTPCTFSIVPTSANFAASGGTRSVNVNASAISCAWTATSNAAWITLTSGASGTGNGTTGYSVAPNTSPSPRTGTLTIAGLTYTVQQAGAASGGPQITLVANLRSATASTHPAGGIAQGAFIQIWGIDMGPAQGVVAPGLPFPTILGEVSAEIRQGGTAYPIYLQFVSAGQIQGVVDSRSPLGAGQLILTYKGQSVSTPVRVVPHNFIGMSVNGLGRGAGVFQNLPAWSVNTATNTATHRDLVVLWGVGLGGVTFPDNELPKRGDVPYNVDLRVGGVSADRFYTGRSDFPGIDFIFFYVPPGAPTGCDVPVQVEVEGYAGNIVNMAIGLPGESCTSTVDAVTDFIGDKSKFGALVLARAGIFAEIEAGEPPTDLTLDLGLAAFGEVNIQGGISGLLGNIPTELNGVSVPPLNTCQAYSGGLDLDNLLEGVDLGNLDPGGVDDQVPDEVESRAFDAGAPLTLTGPGGQRTLDLADEESPGVYVGLLGGDLSGLGLPPSPDAPDPLFLMGGLHTLMVPGGPDLARFETSFQVPEPITWLNRKNTDTIRRSQDLRIQWSGGRPDHVVLIGGVSVDANDETAGGFVCVVDASRNGFTVQRSLVSNMPVSGPTLDLENSAGILGLVDIPNDLEGNTFTAPGLDIGLLVNTTAYINGVTVID